MSVKKANAKVFIAKLWSPQAGPNGIMIMHSTSPGKRWLQRVNKVTDTTLVLTNANGIEKTLNLATGKLKVVDATTKSPDVKKKKETDKETDKDNKKSTISKVHHSH